MTVSLEKLRELGVEVKQLQKATDILCAEVTGQTADSCKAHGDKSAADSSAGQKQETLKVSNHPARKERVDEAMNTIRPMITRMKSNSDEITSGKLGFDCTNELRVKIQPDLEEWRDAINSVAIEMSELENLTQGPTYNNAAIAQTTTSIKDAVKRVEVVRRRVYNAVRKSSKTY